MEHELIGRGYNIGVRLIEDFLAKSNTGRCHDLKETADVISKVTPEREVFLQLDCVQDLFEYNTDSGELVGR